MPKTNNAGQPIGRIRTREEIDKMTEQSPSLTYTDVESVERAESLEEQLHQTRRRLAQSQRERKRLIQKVAGLERTVEHLRNQLGGRTGNGNQ